VINKEVKNLQTTKTLTRHFVTPSPKGRGERTAFTLAEGATHVGICDNVRHRAFTLAEVLITLGIIGVVAAMTIPTLVANYQEKSWNTSAQVFERKLTEALRVMNTQQTLAGHTTTQSFVDELAKHFKIVKTCDSNNLKNCVEENITWNIIDISNGGSESETLNLANLKTAADLGKADWGTETIGVQFANGTTAIMAYDPSCRQDPYSNQVTGMSCISMIYDTSGGKSPNATSKDVRAYNNKIANCAFKSGSTCFGQPFKPEAHVWNACDGNGVSTDKADLAFMQKYGLTYCLRSDYGTNDYWAGAVATCGGVDKMATTAQLVDIATYIYGIAVTSTGTTSCPKDDSGNYITCRNESKTLSLGFNFTSGSSFIVWPGEEASSHVVYGRRFSSTSSGRVSNLNRNNRTPQAVCLGD